VKVLIVGGTSGITDWRSLVNEGDPDDWIKPGDIVFPWSAEGNIWQRGLPGTEYETSWPRYDMTMDDPFCPETMKVARDRAETYVDRGLIRRVHTPDSARVALVLPSGITFEFDYDIRKYSAINQIASLQDPENPTIHTLHGDCVNPVLCRLLGIHEMYYHMVANVAQGMPMKRPIVEELHDLYTSNFAEVTLDFEAWMWESLPVPDGTGCKCLSSKHVAPEVFGQAMTQPAREEGA
jgi:hypothetical protein